MAHGFQELETEPAVRTWIVSITTENKFNSDDAQEMQHTVSAPTSLQAVLIALGRTHLANGELLHNIHISPPRTL